MPMPSQAPSSRACRARLSVDLPALEVPLRTMTRPCSVEPARSGERSDDHVDDILRAIERRPERGPVHEQPAGAIGLGGSARLQHAAVDPDLARTDAVAGQLVA